jgi:hypothetical protein
MTEQQNHLSNLLEQRQILTQELESLKSQISVKQELFFKVQGIIEYLTQLGVTLPDSSEEKSVEKVKEEKTKQ